MIPPKGKHMWSVKVGEKGQFVIPKEAREVFGIKPGDTLLLLGDEERGLAIPPKNVVLQMTQMMYAGDNPSEKEQTT